MVTKVILKAEVYRNVYQENEPVRPDDTSAVRGEVGVTKWTARIRSLVRRWVG